MAYSVQYRRTVLKQLQKLDKPTTVQILGYMDGIAQLADPGDRGKALVGDKQGLWRYRVGKYRVICFIDDDECVVLALEVGHRGKIY